MSFAAVRVRRRIGMVAAASLLWPAAGSMGVVVANRSVLPLPTNGYVGDWNGSSAVAIAPNWIISARHVGGNIGGLFVWRGQRFRAVEIREHPTADIELIRVAETLPGYHRLAQNVTGGQVAVLGGWGVTAGNPVTNGYDWSGPRAETWGMNTIDSTGGALTIRFDRPGSAQAVPHEAIFAVHDSGAGLFVYGSDGALELAGIASSVTNFGQSVYGNLAYSVNLDPLRNWIAPIAMPGDPVTSSIEAPRSSLFGGGAPSVIWAAGVGLGLAAARRRRATQR